MIHLLQQSSLGRRVSCQFRRGAIDYFRQIHGPAVIFLVRFGNIAGTVGDHLQGVPAGLSVPGAADLDAFAPRNDRIECGRGDGDAVDDKFHLEGVLHRAGALVFEGGGEGNILAGG